MLKPENISAGICQLTNLLDTGRPITNNLLKELCIEQGLTLTDGQGENQLLQEIVEVAVNKYIESKYCNSYQNGLTVPGEILTELQLFEKRLPTQSWRTNDKLKFQQFSTPPAVALLLNEFLKPAENHLILEPSAGTGCLAVWPKIKGCRFHLNEFSERRRLLLRLQGFEPTGYDAEFLDDLLPQEVCPDAVLMNPPFSANAGRTKTNNSIYGLRHIRSALARLKSGGRLVALLGTEGGTKSIAARKFWSEISDEGNDIRAIINLPKNAFYKYGTTIETSIICLIKKDSTASPGKPNSVKSFPNVTCRTLEEGLRYSDIFSRLLKKD